MLRKPFLATLGLAALLMAGPTQAAPLANTSAPNTSASNASAPITAPVPTTAPDYGGRDAPLATAGDAAPNPAAQAGRALEALVVVLAGVACVVYVLKRFHLVVPGAGGKPARIAGPGFAAGGPFGRSPAVTGDAGISVVSSQSLPGGAMLHIVQVAGKRLLIGATAQSVTTLTEWSVSETAPADLAGDFEDYLTRADSSSGIAAANARLRSLLSRSPPEEPS